MSILSGADIVLEFDRTALFNFLRAEPLMARFRTPFEEEIAIPESSGGGTAHFIFDDSDVFLTADGAVELRLSFSHSSIVGNSTVRTFLGIADLARQSGTVSVFVPLSIEPGREPSSRDLMLNLLGVRGAARFEPPMPGSPGGTSTIQRVIASLIAAEIQQRVRAAAGDMRRPTNPRIPLPIRVDRTAPPSLTPLVCRDLRLRVLAPANPDRQSLVVFIALREGGLGRPEERAERDLPPGQNFALAIAPWVFRDFIFTPAVQRRLLIGRPELLPSVLGRAESVPYPELPEASITRIESTLRDNTVGILLRAHIRTAPADDAFGSTIHLEVRASVTFTVDTLQRIVPHVDVDEVSAERSFGWGWWLIGIFGIGPFISMGFTAALTGGAGPSIAEGLTPTLDAVNVPLRIPQGTLQRIDVNEEQFVLAGTVPQRPVRGSRFRNTLEASVAEAKRLEVDSGTYQTDGCPAGDYPYNIYHRSQRVTFTARPSFASRPVSYAWSVFGISPPERISGRGTVRIRVTRGIPEPLPGTTAPADIELSYEVSADGARVTITATPEDGNFALNVQCVATDAAGRTSTQQGHVAVVTRQAVIGGTWNEDLNQCIRTGASQIGRQAGLAGMLVEQVRPPRQGALLDITGPLPEEIGAFLMQAARLGKKGALQVDHALLTYGPEFHLQASTPAALPTQLALRLLQEEPDGTGHAFIPDGGKAGL